MKITRKIVDAATLYGLAVAMSTSLPGIPMWWAKIIVAVSSMFLVGMGAITIFKGVQD